MDVKIKETKTATKDTPEIEEAKFDVKSVKSTISGDAQDKFKM